MDTNESERYWAFTFAFLLFIEIILCQVIIVVILFFFLFLRLDQLTRFRLSWIHSFLFLIWMLFDSLWFVMLFITKSFSTFNAFKIVEELGTLQFVSKKVIISKMKVECRQWDWYCHVWTGYKSVNTRLLTQHFQTCTVRYSPFSR